MQNDTNLKDLWEQTSGSFKLQTLLITKKLWTTNQHKQSFEQIYIHNKI